MFILTRNCLRQIESIIKYRNNSIYKLFYNEGKRQYSIMDQTKLNSNLLLPSITYQNSERLSSILQRISGTALWKGATGVSNAGRKKGLQRTRKRIRNLNKGQYIGVGSRNMVWPGLNTPIIKGREIMEQQSLPPDPSRIVKLTELRDKMQKFKFTKLDPLERGYSGHGFRGRKVGPPTPVLGESFEGYESIVLETRFTQEMDGILGRKRGFYAMVVTGNGKGLVGIGIYNAPRMITAISKARHRAGQNLIKINVENGSIPGHFHYGYHRTKVFCERRPPHSGLHCCRIIKSICQVAGIKNIRAKVLHSTNPVYVASAFMQGLSFQKSHQELAEEKQLNVVDISGRFPKVLARPIKNSVRTNAEIADDEELDLDMYTGKGVLLLKKKYYRPAYANLETYQFFMKKAEHARYRYRIRQRLFLEHDGDVASFMKGKYPRCSIKPSIRMCRISIKSRLKQHKRIAYEKEVNRIEDVNVNLTSHMKSYPSVY